MITVTEATDPAISCIDTGILTGVMNKNVKKENYN